MDKIIISSLILAGTFFILVAAIGLVRFKDLYSRLHASTKAPSFGLFLLIIGVCLFFQLPVVYLKGFFIVVFLYLTAPLAAHAIIKSYKQKD
jgi:multicomponent Na+:H+ antiporter subunit G